MIQDVCAISAGGHIQVDDEFDELLLRHEPQLKRLAGAAAQPPFSAEECFREAQFGFWKAAQAFRGDPLEDQPRFTKFVGVFVHNHLCHVKRSFFKRNLAARKIESRSSVWSLADAEDFLNDKIRNALYHTDADFNSPDTIAMSCETAAELWNVVATLPARAYAVIAERYLKCKSLAEAGRAIQATASAAGVYEQRAIAELRRRLSPNLIAEFHHGRN